MGAGRRHRERAGVEKYQLEPERGGVLVMASGTLAPGLLMQSLGLKGCRVRGLECQPL